MPTPSLHTFVVGVTRLPSSLYLLHRPHVLYYYYNNIIKQVGTEMISFLYTRSPPLLPFSYSHLLQFTFKRKPYCTYRIVRRRNVDVPCEWETLFFFLECYYYRHYFENEAGNNERWRAPVARTFPIGTENNDERALARAEKFSRNVARGRW